MAIDLWESGVKVLVVYPGLVDTELFSLPDNDPVSAPVEPIPVAELVADVFGALDEGSPQVYSPGGSPGWWPTRPGTWPPSRPARPSTCDSSGPGGLRRAGGRAARRAPPRPRLGPSGEDERPEGAAEPERLYDQEGADDHDHHRYAPPGTAAGHRPGHVPRRERVGPSAQIDVDGHRVGVEVAAGGGQGQRGELLVAERGAVANGAPASPSPSPRSRLVHRLLGPRPGGDDVAAHAATLPRVDTGPSGPGLAIR